MSSSTAITARENDVAANTARRFSEGMERFPTAPSTLRVGRFSDGTARSVALTPDRLGSFADGLTDRPDASATRRVGSFGDTQSAALRRPTRRVGGRPAVASA